MGALTTYTWDEENRLSNIAYPTGALSTYLYSADGLRRKREESGQSLLEVWDGTQLLQEKDSTTKAEVTRYLLQNDSYSGLRAQRQASDGVWRYFAYDVQGSTRKLLNSDGTSNLDLLYRAFGQKQAASGAGQTLMQFGAFYGYEWDADSRMWVKARHLSGTQGRWLSQDPVRFDGGDWNIWRYGINNPLTSFDPTGEGIPLAVAVGIAVGAGLGLSGCSKPSKCCCCVTGLNISGMSRIDNATHMGHSFNLNIGLAYQIAKVAGDCTLQWWEKTNVPAIPGHRPNTNTDMFSLYPQSPAFDPWQQKDMPCPGSVKVKITDPPALRKNPGRNENRKLEFRQVVSSAPNCPCNHKSLTVKAVQFLQMRNGQPVWQNSFFTVLR